MAGISARQGEHQVAQTFRRIGLPRSSERVMVSPVEVSRVKSGAMKPFCGAGMFPLVVPPGGILLNQIHTTPTIRIAGVINVQYFDLVKFMASSVKGERLCVKRIIYSA